MAALDTFDGFGDSKESPFVHFFAITPHDVNELDFVTRGLAVGTAGDLEVVTMDGDTIVLPSGLLAANVIHKIRVKQVKAANTTAVTIWGFI